MGNENSVADLNLPIGVALFKYPDDWGIVSANPEFLELFELTEHDFVDRERLERVLYARDLPQVVSCLQKTSREQEDTQCQFRRRTRNSDMQWIQLNCRFLRMEGEAPYIHIYTIDISAQKNAQAELNLVKKQYQLLEELTREIPFEVDVVNWKSLVSVRLQELRGEEGELQDYYVDFSDSIRQLHPLDQNAYVEFIREAASKEMQGDIDGRLNIGHRDGAPKYAWHRVYYRSICDEDGRVVRIIGRIYNIERDKVLQDEVRRDPLTKLLNKTESQHMAEKLFQEFPSGHHVLIVIDIDDFKGINDTFGHTFGDTVICDVAATLRSQFRSDDIVGRVGGDEFMVVMKDTTKEIALEKVKTLCQILKREYSGTEMSRQISVSVGVSFFGKDGTHYPVLFERADYAMYRAKTSGKNGFALADENDNGPVKKKNQKVEDRQDLAKDDKTFLVGAMSLLTHARDIDGSLNLLLEQIGMRYQLDYVAVTEAISKDVQRLTNLYSVGRGYFEPREVPYFEPEGQEWETGELRAFTAEINLPRGRLVGSDWEQNARPVRSILALQFGYVSDQTGYLYYIARDDMRVFSEEEMVVFAELARIITIFISLRYQVNESQNVVNRLQMMDQLTGLYNFESFKSAMRRCMLEADPDKVYALEYLDLNNFGYVNENFGYQVGDMALKVFAHDYMEQPFFVMGSRLYSDFFVMLVAEESQEKLEKAIHNQHQRFANMQNHQYSCNSFGITAGVYVFENTQMDLETAFENAQLAWKQGKISRKMGISLFDQELRKQRIEEKQVIGEFYEALYRADFRMYLQPKFILGSRKVYGAEALARWQKPDGTILQPSVFIGPIEKIGYITELDFFIFEEVLKTLSKWQHQNRDLFVISTNFSGRHFDGDGEEFLNRIQMIMKKYDVLPKYIEIEITEGVFVKNKDTLQHCLGKLRKNGFRVAIDDFGTGYSSLSSLTDIPAEVVKMDKSFLMGLEDERNRQMIIQVAKIASIAGKEIVIEGVENMQQEQFLLESGFDKAQGFLCNRPIKVVEFENLYMDQRK